jgi:hypothetical protein
VNLGLLGINGALTMKTHLKLLLTIAICLASVGAALAQNPQNNSTVDPEKAHDIRLLFQATNPKDLVPQVLDQFVAAFKQAAPNVPQQFWDDFKKKVDVDELIDLMIPIYDKYYTAEDIKAMLAFYNTPTGRKVTATMGPMTQEKMAVMQAWGRKKGMEVEEELRERGIYLQPR